MSVSIIFFLTIVAVVFLTFLLVEKNNTIDSLKSKTEELKKTFVIWNFRNLNFRKK